MNCWNPINWRTVKTNLGRKKYDWRLLKKNSKKKKKTFSLNCSSSNPFPFILSGQKTATKLLFRNQVCTWHVTIPRFSGGCWMPTTPGHVSSSSTTAGRKRGASKRCWPWPVMMHKVTGDTSRSTWRASWRSSNKISNAKVATPTGISCRSTTCSPSWRRAWGGKGLFKYKSFAKDLASPDMASRMVL